MPDYLQWMVIVIWYRALSVVEVLIKNHTWENMIELLGIHAIVRVC